MLTLSKFLPTTDAGRYAQDVQKTEMKI